MVMITFGEVLQILNKSYSKINYRIFYPVPYERNDMDFVSDLTLFDGKLYGDTLMGFCSYDNNTGELKPLDGDDYSLDVRILKWEESNDILTVWEDPREQIECWKDYYWGYKNGINHISNKLTNLFEALIKEYPDDTPKYALKKAYSLVEELIKQEKEKTNKE